jgi:hypothetical protein
MFLILSTFFFLAIVLGAVFGSTNTLRGTTIRVASFWALAGVIIWLVVTVASMFAIKGAGWVDTAHYVVAVVLLCPLIAVLGARRPSANVWNAFVLVPLILVLMWPAVASADVLKGRPLELESPTILAFGLVLVMGAGNYFGTLCGFPALVFACCEVCLVLPLWGHVPDFFPDKDVARSVAAFAMAWAIWLVKQRRIASRSWEGPAMTKLWLDFIDTYGMVWGKRVMDRINEAAAHEKWDCRLELHGFISTSTDKDDDQVERAATPDDATLKQAEPMIRWLMKRFVDEQWVTDRIGKPSSELPTLKRN